MNVGINTVAVAIAETRVILGGNVPEEDEVAVVKYVRLVLDDPKYTAPSAPVSGAIANKYCPEGSVIPPTEANWL